MFTRAYVNKVSMLILTLNFSVSQPSHPPQICISTFERPLVSAKSHESSNYTCTYLRHSLFIIKIDKL